MKKTLRMMIVVLAILMVSACTAKPALNLEGSYQLKEIVSDDEGIAVTEELMENLRSMGQDVTLVIGSDNKGIIDIFGQQAELDFDAKKKQVTWNSTDVYETVFYMDGDMLVIEDADGKMYFTRMGQE